MSQLGDILRYHLRSVVYKSACLRHAVLHGAEWFKRADSGSAKEYWDSVLGGRLKTYLGGTVSIDTRNTLVTVLINHYATAMPKVLDIGCAGGSLARALRPFTAYLGVDISPLAVKRALQDPTHRDAVREGRVTFVASDMCELALDKIPEWDVIVFNEVLYYLSVEEAAKQAARYRAALRPGGILCVSMKDDGKARAIFDGLARAYVWKEGLLWQSKVAGPEYRININRERPAYLLAALAPRT